MPPTFAPGGPPGGGADARAMVQAPAIALIVVGVVMLLGQLMYLLLQLLGTGFGALGVAAGDAGAAQGLFSSVFGIIATIVWMIFSGIILFGGIKMKNLEAHGFAMASAIMAIIPCTTGYCCILGLPVGVWALVVLLKPEVKAAFR